MTKGPDWAETLEDLDRRRQRSWGMGGPERLDKHRGKGKLDARARIERLLDPGTFREIGTLVGGEIAADAIVTGSGLINGAPVMVGAEDFTTLAGSIGGGGNSKRYRIAELAVRDRIPLVMLLDGAGFRAGGGHYGRSPTDLLAQTRCSGRVPTVAAVLGPSAGHGALVAPVCDFRIMSDQGAIFTAGPPVVKESTGEEISKEDLGGPGVALPSGVIHNVADSDEAVLDDVRRYLSYFPQSAWSYPSSRPSSKATQPRATPELLDIVTRENRRVYDMRAVLDVVFDEPDWFEVQPRYGRAIICALAHLGGHPVAVVANQPQVLAGSIDADAADKAAHFIMVADSFHLPIVFLADNPGMLPGSRSERHGRPARRRANVRGPDHRYDHQAASDVAQGVRLRLDGDVAARIRPAGRHIRLSGRNDGSHERRSAEPRVARRRGPVGQAARRRVAGVVPVGRTDGVRRAHRSTRNARRAAGFPSARVVQPAGRGRTGDPHSDLALTEGRR